MNKFLIYRTEQIELAKARGLIDGELRSFADGIAKTWRELPPAEDQRYAKLAEEQSQEHRRKYPGYKYSPRTQAEKDAEREARELQRKQKSKELAQKRLASRKERKQELLIRKQTPPPPSEVGQEGRRTINRAQPDRPNTDAGPDEQFPRHLFYYPASAWGDRGPPPGYFAAPALTPDPVDAGANPYRLRPLAKQLSKSGG